MDSQEEKLQSCHFARKAEVLSGGMPSSSSTSSEQATGIIMVTLHESSDDYQTPPQHQLPSQNSSSDDQVPATRTATLDREAIIGGVEDGQTMVVDDTYERKGKRMVYITNKLEFLEKSHGTLENNDPTFEDNRSITEHTTEETNNENVLKEGAHNVFVEMPKREQEVYNELNQVDPKGKRKFPSPSHETKKKRDVFMDTLNRACELLKQVEGRAGSGDEGVDFLETAKRRGLTFARPRWWPPEGV